MADVGRPTDYREEYCEQILELGRQGKSVVQMACHFDVVKQTMLNWAARYPQFMDALTRAKQLSQDWWETQAQCGLTADKFNSSLWSRSMAARFPDDYQERRAVELSGNQDKPLEVVTRVVVTGVEPKSE